MEAAGVLGMGGGAPGLALGKGYKCRSWESCRHGESQIMEDFPKTWGITAESIN